MSLSENIRNEIKKHIREGLSINKISKSLIVGKSTIYYHYKKIRGKKYKEPIFIPSVTELEGEIVGIFTGDGSQFFEPKKYHYETNVHFGGHNLKYAIYVKGLFEKFFNKKFRLRGETLNRLRLRTESKPIFNYFKTYLDYSTQIKHSTVKLKTMDLPKEFKIGFLRGLVDTDGYVKYIENKKTKKIVFYTTSKDLATQIKSLLAELEIIHGLHVSIRENRNYKPLYYVNVWSISADKFIKIIKPFKARTGRAGSSIRTTEMLGE